MKRNTILWFRPQKTLVTNQIRNKFQQQTTHLSDSRQQNVIDVNTCNYAFKRLHFEPRNCIACHQTLVHIGSRDETRGECAPNDSAQGFPRKIPHLHSSQKATKNRSTLQNTTLMETGPPAKRLKCSDETSSNNGGPLSVQG